VAVEHFLERRDIDREIVRCVHIGDIAGDRRLTRGKPMGLTGCQIEERECLHQDLPSRGRIARHSCARLARVQEPEALHNRTRFPVVTIRHCGPLF
jgi:hypothetical protein